MATILIPWRGGCRYREAALTWVLERHDHSVIIGRHDDGPWCKARAIADALAQTDDDIIALADGDVWCDGLDTAFDRVRRGVSSWAVPHTTVVRLDEVATVGVLERGDPLRKSRVERSYKGVTGGGMVVLRRELYERAPLDPRFLGWGQEDLAAANAWRCLAGAPWRGEANLWHLWHPPQPKLSPAVGSRASQELLTRYRDAGNDPERTLALVAEGRLVLGS